jgi:hypothetical protein
MKIQLSFFIENRKGFPTENWNPPTSEKFRKYFEKTGQYFSSKWAKMKQNDTSLNSKPMSAFAKKQKDSIKSLTDIEWRRWGKLYKINPNTQNAFELYSKRISDDGVLMKSELKLFLWTFIKNEVYDLCSILKSPQYKNNIQRIFHAAINNNISLAERELVIFKNNGREGGDREAIKSTIYEYIDYVLKVCAVLYDIPDFTDIQDLTFMYMSQELNRIHMGPLH